MKFHWGSKDGGPASRVSMYGFESKALFSVLVLRFGEGSREAFHSHAFHAISWVLRGKLTELISSPWPCSEVHKKVHLPSGKPIITTRDNFHKVLCETTVSWVLTLRGRWAPTWVDGNVGHLKTLTHGRKEVSYV